MIGTTPGVIKVPKGAVFIRVKGLFLIVPLTATRDKWWFQFWLRGVHGDDLLCVHPTLVSGCFCLRGVLHSAHCGDVSEIWSSWLRGMMHTTEIDLAVWCTPWRLTQRCMGCRSRRLTYSRCVLYTKQRQLCDRISRGNRNKIRKSGAQIGLNSYDPDSKISLQKITKITFDTFLFKELELWRFFKLKNHQ